MKTKSQSKKQPARASRRAWSCRCVIGAMLLTCGAPVRAGDTNRPAMTGGTLVGVWCYTYNNWVDLSVGGLMVHGNTAQAQQRYQLSNEPFGGISDLHLQQDIAKGTTFTLDGHSLFDQHDYKMVLGLQRDELGY